MYLLPYNIHSIPFHSQHLLLNCNIFLLCIFLNHLPCYFLFGFYTFHCCLSISNPPYPPPIATFLLPPPISWPTIACISYCMSSFFSLPPYFFLFFAAASLASLSFFFLLLNAVLILSCMLIILLSIAASLDGDVLIFSEAFSFHPSVLSCCFSSRILCNFFFQHFVKIFFPLFLSLSFLSCLFRSLSFLLSFIYR